MPVEFAATILKFGAKGEKTGWTYIEISPENANRLNKGVKTSYYVNGKLDNIAIAHASLIPMGDGSFILPLNAAMRKQLKKNKGETIAVKLSVDKVGYQLNSELIACLKDEKEASSYFFSLPKSHQKYFSKWIDGAKTTPTKAKRIAMCIEAFYRKLNYAEMLHAYKKTI